MTTSTRRGHHYTNYTGTDNHINILAPLNSNFSIYNNNNKPAIIFSILKLERNNQLSD